MAPEHLSGNMWKILEGESVTGRTSVGTHTIKGPRIVRVHNFDGLDMMRIQADPDSIEVDGTDIEKVVKTDATTQGR